MVNKDLKSHKLDSFFYREQTIGGCDSLEEKMKCVMCENKKNLKSEITTVKYRDCGLDNITIHNIEKYKCPVCGEEYFQYGDIEKLHEIIAALLLRKQAVLSGNEIRFLRTYLGYSTQVFSKLTRYNQATISRFENGKQDVSLQFDILLRSLVANRLPDRDYDLHDLWIKQEGESIKRIELAAQKNGWKILKRVA